MKVRLVQDSYSKRYNIERWEETTYFPLNGDQYKTYGRWAWVSPTEGVRGFYSAEERELALKEFQHYVNKLNATKIVVQEANINEVQ